MLRRTLLLSLNIIIYIFDRILFYIKYYHFYHEVKRLSETEAPQYVDNARNISDFKVSDQIAFLNKQNMQIIELFNLAALPLKSTLMELGTGYSLVGKCS